MYIIKGVLCDTLIMERTWARLTTAAAWLVAFPLGIKKPLLGIPLVLAIDLIAEYYEEEADRRESQ